VALYVGCIFEAGSESKILLWDIFVNWSENGIYVNVCDM
jgi:hypothetical protein